MPVMPSKEDFFAERDRQTADAKRERARAEALWRKLEASGDPKAWRDLLADSEFQSWALCEKLCHESAWLAEEDNRKAGELLDLAQEMIPRLALEESFRSALQEYVWMHVADLCRARGDLRSAEDALARAKEHFLASTRGMSSSPLERARLSVLESALLRDQGNHRESIRQMDFAVSVTSSGNTGANRAEILLEHGLLHRWLGSTKEAHQSFSQAAERAPKDADPRLLLRIHLELGNLLCDLGRHAEIKELPAPVRREAEKHPTEKRRLVALEGGIAVGLGRVGEAEAAVGKLRAEPPGRAAGDAALLFLEVAALYVKEGRTAELRELTEEMVRLAEASELSREAAATLKLFCRLAGQDKLTVERAPQFARDFPRVGAEMFR